MENVSCGTELSLLKFEQGSDPNEVGLDSNWVHAEYKYRVLLLHCIVRCIVFKRKIFTFLRKSHLLKAFNAQLGH
jgi:hypothetical protein